MGRFILTKNQCDNLLIRENEVKKNLVKRLVKELNQKYERSSITREDEQRNPKKIAVLRKIYDGEEIPPKQVLRELKGKHSNLSEDFIKQVIKDWYNQQIDDNYFLTKNVKINDDGERRGTYET